MKFEDLSNRRFSNLFVMSRIGSNDHGHALYSCLCDCGNIVEVPATNLRSGNSTQCLNCKYDQLSIRKRLRPFEALYRLLQRSATHPVKLSYEEFVEFAKQTECHYCGEQIFWSEFSLVENGTAYNLDRKDTTGPYSSDNCVACCKRCNIGKGTLFNYAEWFEIGQLIRTWKK